MLWSTAFLPGSRRRVDRGRQRRPAVGREDRSRENELQPAWRRGVGHFSPKGESVVTGSWDNMAKIWDAEDGRVIHKLENGHTRFHQYRDLFSRTESSFLPRVTMELRSFGMLKRVKLTERMKVIAIGCIRPHFRRMASLSPRRPVTKRFVCGRRVPASSYEFLKAHEWAVACRCPLAPHAARRQRTHPSDRGFSASPAGRGLAPQQGQQRVAVGLARVLPGVPAPSPESPPPT